MARPKSRRASRGRQAASSARPRAPLLVQPRVAQAPDARRVARRVEVRRTRNQSAARPARTWRARAHSMPSLPTHPWLPQLTMTRSGHHRSRMSSNRSAASVWAVREVLVRKGVLRCSGRAPPPSRRRLQLSLHQWSKRCPLQCHKTRTKPKRRRSPHQRLPLMLVLMNRRRARQPRW